MTTEKNKKIKIYLVIGLALVLVISFYFRFIQAKVVNSKDRTPPQTSQAQSLVPHFNLKKPQIIRDREPAVNEYLETAIRDIFMPMLSPAREETPSLEPAAGTASKQPTALKLKGTIIGGKRPIAIIDDQLVRLNDWIGEYRVARIGKKEVLLDSGDQKITLEILKNE